MERPSARRRISAPRGCRLLSHFDIKTETPLSEGYRGPQGASGRLWRRVSEKARVGELVRALHIRRGNGRGFVDRGLRRERRARRCVLDRRLCGRLWLGRPLWRGEALEFVTC